MLANVLLYPCNLINYLRLLLLLIMFYNIKQHPLLAFITSMIGGFIDLLDGPIARYYLITSKIGQFLDILMDRLTIIILFIFLSRFYTKYWHVFCLLALIEFSRDLSSAIVNTHTTLLNILNFLQTSTISTDLILKTQYDFYSRAGLRVDKLMQNETLKKIIDKNIAYSQVNVESASLSKFFKDFENILTPFTWYLSDLFFWIMYCGAFAVNKKATPASQYEQHTNLVDLNNNIISNTDNTEELVLLTDDYSTNRFPFQIRNEFGNLNKSIKKKFLNILREFKLTFKIVILVSDSIGSILNDVFVKTILARLKFNIFNLKIIFRIFGLICYFFTLFRFYLNFCTIFSNMNEIINIDYKYIILMEQK